MVPLVAGSMEGKSEVTIMTVNQKKVRIQRRMKKVKKQAKLIAAILFCVFGLGVNFYLPQLKAWVSEGKAVVLYEKVSVEGSGDYYFAEDSRGNLYVVESGNENLSFEGESYHFAKIRSIAGNWYVTNLIGSIKYPS